MWALLLGLPLGLAACGGGDETPPPPPKALVPSALQDTAPADSLPAVADTAEVPMIMETQAAAEPDRTPPPPPPVMKETPPKTSVSANTGPFSLQLGSFRTEANADKRMSEIKELGYNPAVEKADIGGTAYFRVVLRGLETQEKAGAIGEKIRTALDIEYLVRRTD